MLVHITFAKEVMFYLVFVSLSVCLSHCLFVSLCHTAHCSTPVCTRLYTELGTDPGKNWLNVGSYPRLNPNPVWWILRHCKDGEFSNCLCLQHRGAAAAVICM